MTPQTQQILDYLNNHKDVAVDFLVQLANTESPSDNPEAIRQVFSILESGLENAGLEVRRISGQTMAATLYARPPQNELKPHRQLLIGHCDTVWPISTLSSMPVVVEGDTIRGPGVFDMKGGLTQMIFALKTIHELELKPSVSPLVIINADEEVGSPESSIVIRRFAPLAVRAFVLEPAFGTSGKLKTARKAVGRFHVIIQGKPAHAGVNPQDGISAILEMSHQIQHLFALNDASQGITVNVGTIDGGLRPNVIAPEVEAVLDVRVPTEADARRIESAIRGLRPINSGATITVRGGFGRPSMEKSPRNQALWKLARRLGETELGLDLEQAAVGGASDGNTTSLHTATLDGLGAVGDGAHAHHEHLLISKMIERTALLCLLLLSPPGSGPI